MTRCLLDTNIILRLSQRNDPRYQEVRASLRVLRSRDFELCYISQCLAEFWNVCTRPAAARSGYGLSVAETDWRARLIERLFTLLPDSRQIHDQWRQLVVYHSVMGLQVYDARIVAAMKAHAVSHLLTLNKKDFTRYPEITVVAPPELLSGNLPV